MFVLDCKTLNCSPVKLLLCHLDFFVFQRQYDLCNIVAWSQCISDFIDLQPFIHECVIFYILSAGGI